mmetsp:Transcript_30647/g.85838  ORF Transcript_30647/g.85838 Transcript_30647/m.85838 type:complete len:610 (+) Transcript_30647:1-1830(+)
MLFNTMSPAHSTTATEVGGPNTYSAAPPFGEFFQLSMELNKDGRGDVRSEEPLHMPVPLSLSAPKLEPDPSAGPSTTKKERDTMSPDRTDDGSVIVSRREKSYLRNLYEDVSRMCERAPEARKSLLAKIFQTRCEIAKALECVRLELIDLHRNEERVRTVSKTNQDIKQAIEWAARQVQLIYQSEFLCPQDIYTLMELHTDLFVHSKQLELYQYELYHFVNGEDGSKASDGSGRGIGNLVITRQPFPKPLKQNTRAASSHEDPIEVILLTGARVPVVGCCVRAELVYEEYHQKGGNFIIQGGQKETDSRNRAVLTDIRFSKGTRLKMVRIQFVGQVSFQPKGQQPPITMTTESEPSCPFIIMTNESQWDYSEGILFQKDAFSNNDMSWVRFANLLQNHYMKATRQDPELPDRPLSLHDINYIHRLLFYGQETVSQKDFDSFWKWFGKVLQKIRHQKPFCQLWNKGLISGFVSKPEANELLQGQQAGAFLIRFSERAAGKLAIAYNRLSEETGKIETSHYLIAPHDKKETMTIPDFLGQCDSYVHFLLLKLDFQCDLNGPISSRIRGLVHKNEALVDYYTKKLIPAKGLEGYENTGNVTGGVSDALQRFT